MWSCLDKFKHHYVFGRCWTKAIQRKKIKIFVFAFYKKDKSEDDPIDSLLNYITFDNQFNFLFESSDCVNKSCSKYRTWCDFFIKTFPKVDNSLSFETLLQTSPQEILEKRFGLFYNKNQNFEKEKKKEFFTICCKIQ